MSLGARFFPGLSDLRSPLLEVLLEQFFKKPKPPSTFLPHSALQLLVCDLMASLSLDVCGPPGDYSALNLAGFLFSDISSLVH